ncbi:MAG: hypothetical protein LC745_01000 [Planctomycetia bacterium]|nr:hypothetical protein [Planctomycetia bacterium]
MPAGRRRDDHSEGLTDMKRGLRGWAVRGVLGVGLVAAVSAARAQPPLPAVPGVPGAGAALPGAGAALPGAGALGGAGAVSGLAGVPAAVPAQPATLWGFLGLSKGNLAACKAKLCQSQFGALLNNATMPLSALSGGLIGGCCPTTPTPAQLAAAGAAGGAEGVAAQIKAEEAQAKAKIAAIEYLATVDCRYWPDAEGALMDRLRADRNECVRYAAARALGTGCCCTKKTIAALTLVVQCDDSDGNPAERSERVKAAAWYALNHCVTRYVPPRPEPRERPSESPRREYPTAFRAGPRSASSFEETLANTPDEVVIADARRALAASRNAPLGERTLPTGSRSMFNVVSKAASPPQPQAAAEPTGTASGVTTDGPRDVVIRSTAPPHTPAPPVVLPATAGPDVSVRRAAAEAPEPATRRPPRSLLDVFAASRRSRPGA